MTAEPTVEVEPVLTGALELLHEKPDAKLGDLAAKVAAVVPATTKGELVPFPALPARVELTEEARRALEQLPAIFNGVEIKDRRSLTQPELDKLTLEESVISVIASVLGPRHEVIKETIRVHMDVEAEEKGLAVPKDVLGPGGEVIVAATPRDQSGHYLLARSQDPHQVIVGPVKWSQEYSAAAAMPSQAVLEALFRDGAVSREEYLAVTRPERVLDTDKLRALIRKSPQSGLSLLRQITVTGKAKASLYLRKQS